MDNLHNTHGTVQHFLTACYNVPVGSSGQIGQHLPRGTVGFEQVGLAHRITRQSSVHCPQHSPCFGGRGLGHTTGSQLTVLQSTFNVSVT